MDLAILLGLGTVLGIPVAIIWLLIRVADDRRRILRLEARLNAIHTLGAPAPSHAGFTETPRPAAAAAPGAAGAETPSKASPTSRPQWPELPGAAAPLTAEGQDTFAGDEVVATSAPTAGTSVPPGSLERFVHQLASQWMVWAGAIAVALGGVFLVRHAIARGWLGPEVRVALGILVGTALTAGGEALRRLGGRLRIQIPGLIVEEGTATGALPPDVVPTALAASGLFVTFAAVWAGHALYGLIPGLVAFAALGLVSFAAFGLSLLHGISLALLGLLGGFVTPALVSTDHPAALPLFVWLAVISAACVALVRVSEWTAIAYAALAGCALWALAWVVGTPPGADVEVLGPWTLLIAVGFVHGIAGGVAAPSAGRSRVAWVAAATGTAIILMLVLSGRHGTIAMTVLFLLSSWLLLLGRLGQQTAKNGAWGLDISCRQLLPLVTVVAVVISFATLPVRFDPAATGRFVWNAFVFGSLFGLAGFAALWGAADARESTVPRTALPYSAIWAGISAGMPLVLWCVGWAKVLAFGRDPMWTAAALALAALALVAATACNRWRGHRDSDDALAVYGAAVAAFVALAAATTLETAWLTAAIAVEIPAIAWVESKVGSRVLRPVALALATVVAGRLLLNWQLAYYPVGPVPWLSWVLWGYGLPAACFALAARLFRRLDGGDSRLATVLIAGSAVFAVLFVSLELRLAIEGTLRTSSWSLLERSLQTLAWMAAAQVLLRRNAGVDRLLEGLGRILAGLAVSQLVLGNLLLGNPALTGDHLGPWSLADTLLLAYLAPAGFCALLARTFAARGKRRAALLFAGCGLTLVFAWITLEVSRLFQGPVLHFVRPLENGEMYAWSAAWIIYALALLAAGTLLRRLPPRAIRLLRHASLVVMLIATCKVFLFDMADLEGMWRVASLFGLGLTLMGVGWAWRRLDSGLRTAPAPAAVPQ